MQQTYFNLHTHHKPTQNSRVVRNAYHFLAPHVITSLGYDVCCGIHPMHAGRADASLAHLEKLLMCNRVIALGECGLDLRYDNIREQKWAMQQQLELSSKYKLPVIIHCVKMHEPLLQMIKMHDQPIVLHGYLARADVTNKYMSNRSVYFSFGKSIFSSNNHELIKKTVGMAGLDKIFLETDNSHYAISEVYATFAAIINIGENELQNQVQRNFETVFSKKE